MIKTLRFDVHFIIFSPQLSKPLPPPFSGILKNKKNLWKHQMEIKKVIWL